MDKYILIIFIFMIAGMIIAIARGEWVLFYASLGGAIILIFYGSMKNRREHNEKRRENRRSKK